METKEYNELMQRMIQYTINSNSETLDFNTYSQLYYKLKAILEFAEGLDDYQINEEFHNLLVEAVNNSKQDSNYKLEPLFAQSLNQFVKFTGFVYKAPEISQMDLASVLKQMQRLAGSATNLY